MIFEVENKQVMWEPNRLLIAGYTSQDQEALKKHIDELEEIGVKPPPMIPMIYDLSPEILTNDDQMSMVLNDGSGEVEVVLVEMEGKWFVGIGSDHTDRKLEAVSVQKSKQVCAKPISKELWELNAIEENWDLIELRSWVTIDNEEHQYQSGTLKEFMKPQDLLETIKQRGYYDHGMVVFCGTLPLLSESFIYGNKFRAELYDPINDKSISLEYTIKLLKDAEEV